MGLNLTAADTVIPLIRGGTRPWSDKPPTAPTALGRTSLCSFYKLVVEGSIEDRIQTLQQRKSDLADAVLGTDHSGPSWFTPEDLDDLLAPLAGHGPNGL